MIVSLLFLICSQGNIQERTQLPETKAMTSQEWVAWALKQNLVLSGLTDSNEKIGSDGLGLWQKLDQVASSQKKRLRIQNQKAHFQPGIYGPLAYGNSFWRGELESLQLETKWMEPDNKMRFVFQIAWHPQLHPILFQAGSFQCKVKDSKTLVSRPTSWQPVDETLISPLEFFTEKPSRKVVRLESVEGTIRAVVPSQLHWLDMGLVMGKDGILKEVGKTEVKRLLTQRTAKRLSLEVEIRPGPSQFFLESNQEAILTGLAVCVGPEGDRKPAVGQQILESSDGRIRVRYDWLRPEIVEKADQRFELRMGDNFREIEADMKFGPLELP